MIDRCRFRYIVIVAATLAAAIGVALPATADRGQATTGWCGTVTAVDQPDALSALQIHVVYAVPSDAPDRAGERSLPIVSDLATIEAWWQANDRERDLRIDLLSGGCDTTTRGIDLTDVRLPGEGAYYADPTQGFERLAADVEQPGLGLASPDKKYLVYYDGPVRMRGTCGTSPLGPVSTTSTSVVYLDSLCGGDLGAGGEAAATAAHELLHALGARPRLHPCAGSSAHACDSANDLLYPTVEEGVSLTKLRLDVGRDDYYGLPDTRADQPDVRSSPFLERLAGVRIFSPPVVKSLWATSSGGIVTLSWQSRAVPVATRYRVYRDGQLLTETGTLRARDRTTAGATVTYAVRAMTADGFLGAERAIRVLVGSGVVDASGKLIADTIPPPRVSGLRVERTRAVLILRWNAVAGAADLAGYRVYRNGRAFGVLCRPPMLRIDSRFSRARWTVAAVDSSGNLGAQSKALSV